MAFGAILEGPSSEGLQPIVVEAMPLLIMLMKDEFVAVKDTAAWTIGRVCELNSEAALKEEYLQVFYFSLLKKFIGPFVINIDPSLNTQPCIRGLLVVRDFCFWPFRQPG